VSKPMKFILGKIDLLIMLLAVLYAAFAWHPDGPSTSFRLDVSGMVLPVCWGFWKSFLGNNKLFHLKSSNVLAVLLATIVFIYLSTFFRIGSLKEATGNPYFIEYLKVLPISFCFVFGWFAFSYFVAFGISRIKKWCSGFKWSRHG
jgi:hypothetical protein